MADVQSEFQLDRADYLESIRRLQKRLKFYEQLCEKAGQQRGLGWDPDAIRAESQWNDDTARWRIPDGALHAARLRLPPAGKLSGASSRSGRLIIIHIRIFIHHPSSTTSSSSLK